MSAIGIIALAVWFPVTMLTASGISNTRASYLDVARTLGAGRAYLIFRVAIPAAMPNIFIGVQIIRQSNDVPPKAHGFAVGRLYFKLRQLRLDHFLNRPPPRQ